MVSKSLVRSPISFEPITFWCPLSDPYLTTRRSKYRCPDYCYVGLTPQRYVGVIQLPFFYWTPIFHRCVVRWIWKLKHHKDTCLEEIRLCPKISFSTPHSIMNTNWEDLCIQLRNQHTYTSNNHNYVRGGPISVSMRPCRFASATSCFLFKCNW